LLLLRLGFPLRLDYVHATRYRGTTRGGELEWIKRPRTSLRDEHVLIVDDIFDEGITLELIARHCRAQGARSVHSAVLVEKQRARQCDYRPDFVGLEVADRYVFGMGMDYKEYLRNVAGIYAVADQDT
jgi:hypoxanthine phosphoribosyltransferase